MNSMNDQRFFDLAIKVIARQANDAERADLDAVLAREPELRAQFTRLEAGTRDEGRAAARCCMHLIDGPVSAYARERLQTTVRQTLGRPNLQLKSRIVVWHAAGVGCLVWQPRRRLP